MALDDKGVDVNPLQAPALSPVQDNRWGSTTSLHLKWVLVEQEDLFLPRLLSYSWDLCSLVTTRRLQCKGNRVPVQCQQRNEGDVPSVCDSKSEPDHKSNRGQSFLPTAQPYPCRRKYSRGWLCAENKFIYSESSLEEPLSPGEMHEREGQVLLPAPPAHLKPNKAKVAAFCLCSAPLASLAQSRTQIEITRN